MHLYWKSTLKVEVNNVLIKHNYEYISFTVMFNKCTHINTNFKLLDWLSGELSWWGATKIELTLVETVIIFTQEKTIYHLSKCVVNIVLDLWITKKYSKETKFSEKPTVFPWGLVISSWLQRTGQNKTINSVCINFTAHLLMMTNQSSIKPRGVRLSLPEPTASPKTAC